MKIAGTLALAFAVSVAAETCISYDDPACAGVTSVGRSCDLVEGWSSCGDYVWDLYRQLQDVSQVADISAKDRQLHAARDTLEYIRNNYW